MAELPDHLRDVVEDLRRAYPDGVPDEDYLPLLAVLATDFSEEGLSMAVAHLTGRHPIDIVNDAAAAQSIRKPSASHAARVRDHLIRSGTSSIPTAEARPSPGPVLANVPRADARLAADAAGAERSCVGADLFECVGERFDVGVGEVLGEVSLDSVSVVAAGAL